MTGTVFALAALALQPAMGAVCEMAPEVQSGSADASGTPLVITVEDFERGYLRDAVVVIETTAGLARDADAVSAAETALIASGAVVSWETLFDFGDQPTEFASEFRYRVLRLDPGVDSVAVAHQLSEVPGITAEPVRVGRQMAGLSPNDPRPNDPLFGDQYALENIGQSVNGVSGSPRADIRVVDAWARQTGSPEVTIAVIDAGVSATHPDLVQKLVPGYNIIANSTNTDALYNAHGTQVAGVAAADSNNQQGVTGVSWGSRLMPVVAANVLGFTSDAWLAEGLVWAVDHGADVVVMSFGLTQPSTVLHDAIRYADAMGVVVCASAGNAGIASVYYPAAFPETIAVGATTSNDELAGFSNRGPEVDLVAPGVNIYTCFHTAAMPDTYVYASGTSVATPMVAGVAALLLSAKPELRPSEVRELLTITARDLGPVGRDDGFGSGRLNAAAALARALGETACLADVNGDGSIDQADFGAWVAAYNAGSLRADQNRNNTVDAGDFSAFVANYRSSGRCRDYAVLDD